jgi:transcriptional regulator with XRE-family HTH domain
MDPTNPNFVPTDNLVVLEDNSADAHDTDLILDENTIILAAGDTYSLIDMAGLRAALRKSGKSYEDISEEKGISLSSIYKFFRRKSKSPSFYNVLMIFQAAGASVDELCGLRPPAAEPEPNLPAKLAELTATVDSLRKTVENQSKLIDAFLHDLHRSDDY